MKKKLFTCLSCLLMATLLCCSDDKPKQQIVSRINGYELSLDDFQRQLALELELDEDFKLTAKTKQQFLEELIRKELLIQEAKKRKLDQEKKFMRTIEQYWESTLIRNLIDLKSHEINQKTVVSQEEIKLRYDEMKQRNPALPNLTQLTSKIERRLREEKKSRRLKEWMNHLRKNADIEIDSSML